MQFSKVYLATFEFRASPDASGTFDVTLRAAERTVILDSFGQPMELRSSSKATLTVR